eukprot:SAG31_NODE_2721_length_5189_cov_4.868566_2_plen_67_part_00
MNYYHRNEKDRLRAFKGAIDEVNGLDLNIYTSRCVLHHTFPRSYNIINHRRGVVLYFDVIGKESKK